MKGAEALERVENLVMRLRRAALGLRNVRSGLRRGLPGGLLLGLPGGLRLRWGLPVLRGRRRTVWTLSAHDGQALDPERSELAAEREGTAAAALLLLLTPPMLWSSVS